MTDRKALFLFESWERSLGTAEAVVIHWTNLPPGKLESLDFDDWVEVFNNALFEHPAKKESLGRIKKMAISQPQRETYFYCLGVYHRLKREHKERT